MLRGVSVALLLAATVSARAEAQQIYLEGSAYLTGSNTIYTCNKTVDASCSSVTTPDSLNVSLFAGPLDFSALYSGQTAVGTIGGIYTIRETYDGSFSIRYAGADADGNALFEAFNVSAEQGWNGCYVDVVTCTYNMASYSAAGPFPLVSHPVVKDPVVEPATWGMMLLGFGAIGLAMRRKRKLQQAA